MDDKDCDAKEVTFDLPSEDVDTESGYAENGDISESKTSLSSDSSFSHPNGSQLETDISPRAEISHISGISSHDHLSENSSHCSENLSHVSEISSPVSLQPSTSTPQTGSRDRVYIDRGNMIARIRKKKSKNNNSAASVSSNGSKSDLGSQLSLSDGPEQIKVPIIGFEVMEERSKFTVFKIQVNVSKIRGSWYVFRRYSDFAHLNAKLKKLFPGLRLALPPKRWFKDNFDRNFLEDRMLGLQAFSDNVTNHEQIKQSKPVREFFCLDEPPGPHDSLEESRAHCDELEDTVYSMRKELAERDTEINLLQEELRLYKSQVEMLSKALREKNTSVQSIDTSSTGKGSPVECDLLTCTEADQSQMKEKISTDRHNGQNGKENEEFASKKGPEFQAESLITT